MQPVDFDEANVTLEAPDGDQDDDVGALPAVQGILELRSGNQVPALASRWSPSDEQREAIAEGADVYLHVLGNSHPVVMLATRLFATPVPPEESK